jgi:hypothetical protein
MANNSPISTKQKKVLTVMANNSTNINKTKESFNSDGQQFTNINKTHNRLSPQLTEHKKYHDI